MTILQFGATTTDFDNAMPSSLTTSRTQIVGVDSILIIIVSTEADPTHDSVTFNAVGLTKIIESVRNNQRRTSIWRLINPPVVTANIVCTLGAVGDIGMIAHSWQGVNQTTPVNASAANDDTDPPGSGDPNTTVASASGEVAIDGFGHDDDATNPVAGAGQTELADVEVIGDFRMASSSKAGAAPNVTLDWTMSANDWTSVAISLNPAAPPAVPDQPIQMVL
jgi:hypothetical protein